jgi:hypothetical protein
MSDKLASMLRDEGSDQTFRYVAQQLIDNPSFAHDCHPLMHMLGHAAVTDYGSFAGAMSHANELCNSGFIHGAIEVTMAQAPDLVVAAQSMCGPDAAKVDDGAAASKKHLVENFAAWECYHGVGHGVMLAEGRQVESSLTVCEKLPSRFATDSCANGVFMEHFIVVDHTGVRRPAKDIDVSFTMCEQTATVHRADCYYYAPSAYLGLYPGQYQAAYDWCRTLSRRDVVSCIQGVGGQAMKDNDAQPEIVRTMCQLFDRSDRTACVQGAIGMYINNHASSAAALPLCKQEFRDFGEACQAMVDYKKQTLDV